MTDETASPAPVSSEIYYSGNYWNNRPEVLGYLNARATGDPGTKWSHHLLAHHGRPFEKVLAFNCGNGWVERELFCEGVARSGVGVDISEDLLAVAVDEAARGGLPLEYHFADTNTFDYDTLTGVDCVLNYAAGHHLARLDTVFHRLANLLRPGGVFAWWDYTGPHRNQYPAAQWEAMHDVNESLPPALRKRLTYPHLPTMLATDPSEAVHSERLLPTLRRYFDIVHIRYLGGPIAYELLNGNDAFFDPAVDSAAEVHRILEADAAYTDADPERRTLFTYVIATPKAEPPDPIELAGWLADEARREQIAAENDGRYYPSTVVGALTERIELLERELQSALDRPPVVIVRPPVWRRAAGRARRELTSRVEQARAPRA